MSAFRPAGTKAGSALEVQRAYEERKVSRMIASGTDPELARHVLRQSRLVAKARRDQRRHTGARIREHGV